MRSTSTAVEVGAAHRRHRGPGTPATGGSAATTSAAGRTSRPAPTSTGHRRGRGLPDRADAGSRSTPTTSRAGAPRRCPAPPADAYGAGGLRRRPVLYWRLGEATGTVGHGLRSARRPDRLPTGGGDVGSAPPAAIRGTANTAAGLRRHRRLRRAATRSSRNPPNYSSRSCGSRPRTTAGGKLIGFGTARPAPPAATTGTSTCDNDGKLIFGIWTGVTNTITTPDRLQRRPVAPRRRDAVDADGMKLYVDGALVGTNAQTDGPGLHRLLAGRRRQPLGLLQPLLRRHHRRGRCLLRRC